MEEEDPNPEYEERKRKPIFRRDRHLQSALHQGEIAYMFANWKNPAGLKKEHLLLKKDLGKAQALPSDQFIHWALLHLYGLTRQGDSRSLSDHMRVANQALDLSMTDFCGMPAETPSTNAPPFLRHLFILKTKLSRITRKITFSEDHTIEYNFFGCHSRCYGNLHMVWVSDQFAYIITHSHFVAVRDCINAWFSALSYALIADRKYPGFSLYQEVYQVIQAVMLDIGIYKDAVYDILKSWQPLVIATVLKDMEANPSFYQSLEEVVLTFPHSTLIKIATRPLTTHMGVHLALELTGLTKCFGHPEVVMDSSVAAWIEKGTIIKPGLEEVAEDIRSAFVLEFSRNYYKQKRRWPNLVFGEGHDRFVKQCYDGGHWGEAIGDPWSEKMFRNIRFEKTLEFDYQVYTADLLADKSIIPGRSHWPYEYDIQAHRTNYGFFPSKPERESNNVIMQYLSREEVNVRSIIETISAGRVPDEWKVTVGVAKEREMKKYKARFFGKLTLEMRLFQVATENNIKHVFKYIPHQTMTKTEDDLFKHLLKISETSSVDSGSAVFMSMDFSSWCTSFRFEGVTPLFQELDRLLGVKNVMAYTQRFPLESILLFQDRFNPPRQGPNGLPRNGPRCIHGPEAWMEGLRQKGWTLATIMLILIASWRCGTIATLTGQGDNQVIYLRLPKRETLEGLRLTRSQYIRWYQTTLEELCTKAGITLKLEETWVSTSLLEYGREFFFKGAQVSSAIKRISRVASEANQTIPSFNGDISGIFSAGMGTAQKDHVPHHAYWSTILEASIAMIDRFPSLSKHPVEFRVALLSVTRTLGGWPITLFPQFCTRSVQDPLTCSLHLVRTLMKSPRHREHILRVATTRVRNPDPAMLIKDPQSLPLHMPRQPENYLKEKIAEGLPKIIVNKELKPLFAEEVEGHKTSLIGDLMAIRPCNPKLLSKLLTLSNVGKQEALISKFSSTRSIQNIACREWSSEIQVLKDIAGMENTTLSHILSRGSDVRLSLMNDNMCLTAYAQELREVSWGIPLEGVTMPAQQEQAQVCLWDKVPLDMYDYAISLSTEGAPGTAWDLDRGPVPPYIGAPTRIRAKRQPLQEMESYSFTKTLSQALQLRSWVKGDAGMTKLLDTIIQEKTDASTEELDRRTAHVYSGSLTHRLSCPTMSRGGQSNSTSNMASHIRVSSSTASAYAKKGEDYTICFQSVFLYGIAVLNLLYHRFKCLPPRTAVVLSRKCCTWLIPPESFTLAESLYPGVPIPTAIMHVEPTKESGLPYTPRGLDVQGSYAAQMAYKFAVWILNRRDTTRISTLEHRALGDVLTPPFVNLSEMSRVNLSALIEQLVCYLVIMDIEFRIRPQHVLAELKSSQTRTGFDDLIDSLELSGLTHVFCSIAHSTPQDLKSRDGWRISLSTVIDAELGKGLRSVVHDNMVIIPEEMEHLFLKWYRTLASLLSHKVDGTLLKSMDAQPLVDLLEEAARKANLHPLIWPPISLSEEESVAGTRRLPRPGRRVMMGMAEPNTSCPEGLNPEPASPSVEEMMFCVQGDRVTNQLYEVILKLKQVDLFSGPIWLYTLGDPGGNLFSLVSHLLPRQIRGGFPRWASEEGDVEASLETGPRCITGDPCDMVYDHNEFLANIDTRGPARMSLEGSNVTVWIVRPRWEGCVDTSRGCLLLTDSTRGFGPGWSLRIRVVFQRVEGVRSAVWSLWQRGAWDKGVKEYHLGLGNASPELSLRRPLECASAGKRMGLECFGLLSSVHHFIQGVPDTRLRLIQMIRRSYTSCVDMIPDIMTPGVAFGFLEPVRERDDAIRRAIVNRVAVLGLIMGMLSAPDPRLCSKERSWIKFHIHFSYGKATRLCQRRCGRDEVDRGMVFVRKYRKPDLSRWWKPCLLLVVSLKEGARPGYGDIKAVVA